MPQPIIPVDVVGLLPVLDRLLPELLRSLSPEEWELQTVARLWKVKDVAAHLLDGNIRILSMLRDGYFGDRTPVRSEADLLQYLNRLNSEWVAAMKRVSPAMLILLHEATGPVYCDYYKSLDPFGKAAFAVAWAGEAESRNWMHIAREYTEKWLHQQQIRSATGRAGLMTKELFYPFIDVFMRALPHTFRDTAAPEGTTVIMTVTSDIGGDWTLTRQNGAWQLERGQLTAAPDARISIDPEAAWVLFSKSRSAEELADAITMQGDQALCRTALSMVSVMA